MSNMGLRTVPERLTAYSDRSAGPDGCWTWTRCNTGDHNGGKYGLITDHDGKQRLAHRVSYRETIGDIPDGMVLDHLCRNTLCINPSHLEVVTVGTNNARGANGFALTGKCVKGLHDMTDPKNIIHRKTDGGRQCRPCWYAGNNRRRQAARDAAKQAQQ